MNQDELQETQIRLERLEKKYKQSESDVQDKSQKINSLNAQIKQIKREAQENNDLLESQNSQNNLTFEELLNQRKQTAEKLHDEVRQVKKLLAEKQSENEKLNDSNKEIKFEEKHNQQEIERLKQALNGMKQVPNPQVSNQEKNVNTQESNEMNRVIQDYRTKLEISQVQIQELQKKLDQQKDQIRLSNEQISEKNRGHQELKDQLLEKQQLGLTKDQETSQQLQQLQSTIKQLKDEKQKSEREKQQISTNCNDLEMQKNKLASQLQNLQQELEETQSQIQAYQKKENKLKNQLDQEEKERNDAIEQTKDQIGKTKKDFEILKREKQNLQLHADQLESEKSKLSQALNQEQQKLKSLEAEYESKIKAMNDMEQKMSLDLRAVQGKKEAMARALASRKSQALKNKMMGGIMGPMESLYQSNDISSLLNGPNAVTDISKYKISLIKINEEQFEKKLNNTSDLNFDQAYTLELLSSISCIRSVNSIAEGDLQQVFLIQVQEDSTNTFNNQIFAIKHFKDTPNFTDSKSACRGITGNLIAKYLMYKYVTMLKKNMKEKIPEPKYLDLFLLEGGPEMQNRNFICEKIVDGKFHKYNGAGQFKETGQLAELCNGFSYFSYIYSQRQVLVSYVQGVELNMYDPVVSTEDGILDENDFGYDEISSFMQGMKEGDAKQMGRKYLAALNIKVT